MDVVIKVIKVLMEVSKKIDINIEYIGAGKVKICFTIDVDGEK